MRTQRNIEISIGVPQGSVLGPLLFLIYINDLNTAIKHSLVHHFADDTNLLHINSSMKKLNKLLNHYLKSLCNWLKANKIALNVAKTEFLFFRSPTKVITDFPKLKIDGKLLHPSQNVKYLGIQIDEFLSFNKHADYMVTFVNIHKYHLHNLQVQLSLFHILNSIEKNC